MNTESKTLVQQLI